MKSEYLANKALKANTAFRVRKPLKRAETVTRYRVRKFGEVVRGIIFITFLISCYGYLN